MWQRLGEWGWIIVFDLVLIAMIFVIGYSTANQIGQLFGWP